MRENALKLYPTDLSDEQWNEIKNFVPKPAPRGRPVEHHRRGIVNAILYIVRSGCAWRLLPKDYAPWATVYDYFRQWIRKGIWTLIHDQLREKVRRAVGKKPASTAAIMGSQSVKIGDQGGLNGYDAGKKIKGRKRHLLVDTLGLILGLFITSAEVQDRDGARGLLSPLIYTLGRLQLIWADAGYLGELVAWVKQLRPFGKLRLEIVKRPEQCKGFHLVRKRWIVERTFGWLMKCRRLVRDYETSKRYGISSSPVLSSKRYHRYCSRFSYPPFPEDRLTSIFRNSISLTVSFTTISVS